MTLEQVIAIEPQVGEILREARAAVDGGEPPHKLYNGYKARLSRLAGWASPRPELATAQCYETVLRALFDAMEI